MTPAPPQARKLWPHALLFLTAVPLAGHLAFSWMGFNPTDDGFILAGARRFLNGQIPHRDYITIRPALPHLLHLPVVALGGDRTYWISRGIVWLQFAFISWGWGSILAGLMGAAAGPAIRWMLGAAGLMLSLHTFPLMAWHTTDALTLLTAGLLAARSERPGLRGAGWFLTGASVLCRQNFLVLPPLAIVLFGRARSRRAWLAAALPGLLYLGLLAPFGALDEAWNQLTTQSGLAEAGFWKYAGQWAVPWGLLIGWRAASAAGPAGPLLLALPAAYAAAGLLMADFTNPMTAKLWNAGISHYIWAPSFLLWGAAAGLALGRAASGEAGTGRGRAAILTAATGWAVSISIGCNTPVLFNGPAAILLLLTMIQPGPESRGDDPRTAALRRRLPAALTLLCLVSFAIARSRFIYEDRPARELTSPLAGVFPGGRGLWTNANTGKFLADLRAAVKRTGGRRYFILPDLAGWWTKAGPPNPLPIDWPQGVELAGNAESISRVREAILGARPGAVVLVQKVSPYLMAYAYRPLFTGGFNETADWARANLRKTGETEFFELYE